MLLLIIIKHARVVIVPRVNSIRTIKCGDDTWARDGKLQQSLRGEIFRLPFLYKLIFRF